MNIVLIGIQGSGKGTLVDDLQGKLEFELISTGQILRDEISTGSMLGKVIEQYIADGQLVSTDLVMQVLKNKLHKIAKPNVVFDGFPREIGQAKRLKEIMNVDLVIHLYLSKEMAIERLLNRLTCNKCKKITKLSAVNDLTCPACGGELIKRTDDTIDSINNRFKIYESETYPLLELYRQWGVKVVDVDASQTPTKVLETVMKVLK